MQITQSLLEELETHDVFEQVAAAGEDKEIFSNQTPDDYVLVGAFVGLVGGVLRASRMQKRSRDRKLIALSPNDTAEKALNGYMVLRPNEGLVLTIAAAADATQMQGSISYYRRRSK